jgi:hypothetical protein
MVGGMDVQTMLSGLVAAARLTVPDDVAKLAADQGRALGAQQVTVFLLDVEQYYLVPLPLHDAEPREPMSIDATLAGRCVQKLEAQEAEGGRQVWIPLLDGLERLGVVQLIFAAREERASEQDLHAFAALLAEIVVVKNAYGDLFRSVRRRQPMSLAAEVAWHLLPPLTFGTDRLVISCVLAPAYDVGGDCFDYSVGDRTAHFAIFDAMGHGCGRRLPQRSPCRPRLPRHPRVDRPRHQDRVRSWQIRDGSPGRVGPRFRPAALAPGRPPGAIVDPQRPGGGQSVLAAGTAPRTGRCP